jgi:hypothetical protein
MASVRHLHYGVHVLHLRLRGPGGPIWPRPGYPRRGYVPGPVRGVQGLLRAVALASPGRQLARRARPVSNPGLG